MRRSARPGDRSRTRWLALAVALGIPPGALAQLPIADLAADHVLLTEVPTIGQFFLATPTITPEYPQVMRVRIGNRGPSDAPAVAVRLVTAANWINDQTATITWPAHCTVARVPGPGIELLWSVGDLANGQSLACDFTIRALASGPPPPAPPSVGGIGLSPQSPSVRPPPPLQSFSGTSQTFTVSPTTRVVSDIGLEVAPAVHFIPPGQTRPARIRLTNRGPDTYGFRLRTVFNPYVHTVTDIPAPDGFRIFPAPAPTEDCSWTREDIGTTQSGFMRRWILFARSLAPGESVECPILIEALANAQGRVSLPVTQRSYDIGVVDPALGDNLAQLDMVFAASYPVPSTDRTGRIALAIAVLLAGVLAVQRRLSR